MDAKLLNVICFLADDLYGNDKEKFKYFLKSNGIVYDELFLEYKFNLTQGEV